MKTHVNRRSIVDQVDPSGFERPEWVERNWCVSHVDRRGIEQLTCCDLREVSVKSETGNEQWVRGNVPHTGRDASLNIAVVELDSAG